MIDHSLVRPELTEGDIVEGCRLAKSYHVASVSVRPSDVDAAVRELQGSDVAVGSVAGFPHGSSTTGTKLYEARDLLRRGAKEIDMVLNRHFFYLLVLPEIPRVVWPLGRASECTLYKTPW